MLRNLLEHGEHSEHSEHSVHVGVETIGHSNCLAARTKPNVVFVIPRKLP